MLHRIALQDMQCVMSAQISSITQIIEDLRCVSGGEPNEDRGEEDAPFYMLTTSRGINGTTYMLYSGVLEKFAGQRGKGIITLPSSVHEVLLLKDTGDIDCKVLTELVKCTSATEVPMEDVPSGNIYRYERICNRIIIII